MTPPEQRTETGRKQDVIRAFSGRWAKGQSANPETQWKPGVCPNPKGRPPIPKQETYEVCEDIRLLCEMVEGVREQPHTDEEYVLAAELIRSLRRLGVQVSVVGLYNEERRALTDFAVAKLYLKPANKIPRRLLLRIIEMKSILIDALRHRNAGCAPSCHRIEAGWRHYPKDGCMSLPIELLEREGCLPRSRAKKIVL